MERPPRYDDDYVRSLFDRMGRTYDVVNLLSSLGFSYWWRQQCVGLAQIEAGQSVCDLMAGGGECWRPMLRRRASVISIDFSPVMAERQESLRKRLRAKIDVRCENAITTSLEDHSVQAVVCAFGLKTLSYEATEKLAKEVHRILKPGGSFSFLEISTARQWWLGPVFRWYVSLIIPAIGKLCLGDIECYKMLGRYTMAFGSCARIVGLFQRAGLSGKLQSHFYGCATSVSGRKTIESDSAIKPMEEAQRTV